MEHPKPALPRVARKVYQSRNSARRICFLSNQPAYFFYAWNFAAYGPVSERYLTLILYVHKLRTEDECKLQTTELHCMTPERQLHGLMLFLAMAQT